jgi:hypothetical protein
MSRPASRGSNTVLLALPMEVIDTMRAYINKTNRAS